MKLGWKKLLLTSFMLFSLFFGAGNLIFPPFLGLEAGGKAPVAYIGFIITAVILPVLGVLVVAKFNGLENLGKLVGPKFAIAFAVIIYLSIGPGLGIPRAASMPYDVAIKPYVVDGGLDKFSWVFLLLYSFVFFALALWLCFTPGKLVKRIGTVLTPSLLILIIALFISFLVKGDKGVDTTKEYTFVKGFVEGYKTMDLIAALNFGLVIATTLTTFGIKEKKGVMKYTIYAGLIAGGILAFVYFMLTYMGSNSSSLYEIVKELVKGDPTKITNGATFLKAMVESMFGKPGAILLAAIFTLACLTTCVGLINSISLYFSTLFKKVSYRKWVIIITVFSFAICNFGLDQLLTVTVPLLDMVYPVSILLIFFGFTSKFFNKMRLVYPITVAGTAVASVFNCIVSLLKEHKVNLGGFGEFTSSIPLFDDKFFWLIIGGVCLAITMLVYGIYFLANKKKGVALATECGADVSSDTISLADDKNDTAVSDKVLDANALDDDVTPCQNTTSKDDNACQETSEDDNTCHDAQANEDDNACQYAQTSEDDNACHDAQTNEDDNACQETSEDDNTCHDAQTSEDDKTQDTNN